MMTIYATNDSGMIRLANTRSEKKHKHISRMRNGMSNGSRISRRSVFWKNTLQRVALINQTKFNNSSNHSSLHILWTPNLASVMASVHFSFCFSFGSNDSLDQIAIHHFFHTQLNQPNYMCLKQFVVWSKINSSFIQIKAAHFPAIIADSTVSDAKTRPRNLSSFGLNVFCLYQMEKWTQIQNTIDNLTQVCNAYKLSWLQFKRQWIVIVQNCNKIFMFCHFDRKRIRGEI